MKENFSGFVISTKYYALVISPACLNSWHLFSGVK